MGASRFGGVVVGRLVPQWIGEVRDGADDCLPANDEGVMEMNAYRHAQEMGRQI